MCRSVCRTCKVRSQHFTDGSLACGGGLRPRWCCPRILLEYLPRRRISWAPVSATCWVMAARKSVGERLQSCGFGIEAGVVGDGVSRGFHRHFFHGVGISQDVLGRLFWFDLVFRGYGLAGMQVDAGVFPEVEHHKAFGWVELQGVTNGLRTWVRKSSSKGLSGSSGSGFLQAGGPSGRRAGGAGRGSRQSRRQQGEAVIEFPHRAARISGGPFFC